MKKTALHAKHLELGAKMVPFAGYEMPVQYNGLIAEHQNVRENVGMFDVSHMGEFFVKGPGSMELLQKVTSNDVSKLSPGKVQYSCLPNLNGGIVDDLLVYCMGEEHYMLVVNASNIDKDWEWINSNNSEGAQLENCSDEYSLLAVQGPRATEALKSLTDIDLDAMTYYTFQTGRFAGVNDVIVSATGYTGAGGFEIYFKNEHADQIWDKIMEAGKSAGIAPAGLGARDTLRMEMGFCLYGNDIDDNTSPLEAGLGWITKLDTGFINSEYLKKQKEEGLNKKLVGFNILEKGPIPRQGYAIENVEGNVIGQVTSGTMSPTLGRAIAMGYVDKPYDAKETKVHIVIRGKKLEAEVTRFPFLSK